MTHFNGGFGFGCTTAATLLHDDGPSFNDDVKVVARLALFDDRFTVLKAARFQRVSHRVTFPFLQTLYNR